MPVLDHDVEQRSALPPFRGYVAGRLARVVGGIVGHGVEGGDCGGIFDGFCGRSLAWYHGQSRENIRSSSMSSLIADVNVAAAANTATAKEPFRNISTNEYLPANINREKGKRITPKQSGAASS